MLDLQEIRRRLADRRPSFISLETGISVTTIREVRDGIQENPKHSTLRLLSEYLERQP